MEKELGLGTSNNTQQQEQTLVTDFSNLFKNNGKKAFKPNKKRQTVKNWLLQIPTNISITVQQMKERKVLDLRRWMSISRPQYPSSCGISSLVSVWNYLYSNIGVGKLEPLTTEKGIQLLGIAKEGEDLKDVNFGKFTGNATLIQWFKILCKQFSVQGEAEIALKLSGKGTTDITTDQGLQSLKQGLKSQNKGYIYHCQNHYFCPIGYQITPGHPLQAYKPLKDIKLQDSQTWIIIGEVSKSHPVFHTRKWSQVVLDLETKWPNFYDIRQPSKGIQTRKCANQQNENQQRGTLNCIIQFIKL